MISLNIPEVKDFMNKLLIGTVFDNFLLQEAVIGSDVTVHIDGRLHKDFYSTEELEQKNLTGLPFLPYGMVRTRCFDLIKGKRTPSNFRFVLLLSPENLQKTLEQLQGAGVSSDISGMFLNIHFQNGELTVITGVSHNNFSLDKGAEHEWDAMLKRFLKKNEIVCEEQG